jgi:hypothetical protein
MHEKNQNAVALGKMRGSKGGKNRAAKLTPEQRSASRSRKVGESEKVFRKEKTRWSEPKSQTSVKEDKGTMKTAKRPRGRPKKEEGREEFWRFVRAGMIVSAYDEARESGQKHSIAVTQAVECLKQHQPEMPISETVVRRTLATFRSRDSQTTLRFKRSAVGKRQLARLRSMLKQAHDRQSEIGLPAPSIQNLPKNLTAYKFGYAKRPHYFRTNRKNPKV